MIILIPMAGKGQRFIDEGYLVSKPLIQVSGKPMIVQATNSLPKGNKHIFICRTDHLKDNIDQVLQSTFQNCKVIDIDYITEGQASTCALSKNYIDMEEELIIGACDNGMVFDPQKFEELKNQTDTDIICFGFTKQNNLALKPESWGWIKHENYLIDSISVKVPISKNPYNDNAVIGSFYFKKAKYFFEIYDHLVKNNIRVNNEFYVDSCIDQAKNLGYKAKLFVVDKYIGWGTPKDLKEYQFWESYFKEGYDEKN